MFLEKVPADDFPNKSAVGILADIPSLNTLTGALLIGSYFAIS